MKKRIITASLVVALSGSIFFSSCIGSFGLSNKLLSWNQNIGDKFVNELVFLAFWIVPVYEICVLADVLVINSIEFWSGSNPMQAGIVKKVEGEKGTYLVETTKNGYEITDYNGNQVSLVYSQDTKTWSAVTKNANIDIITFEDEKTAILHLQNGETQRIDLSQEGVTAFRQQVMYNTFFAVR